MNTNPSFLERESSMLEVLNSIEQATYYISIGFKNQPTAKGCHIHLLPLKNTTWLQSLEAAGMREKSLPGIMDLIKSEAEVRNPVHAHRIQLLKVKKTSIHSDFLQKIERSMEVREWAKMTQDQFLIHLFAESAYQSMNKNAMEILSGTNPGWQPCAPRWPRRRTACSIMRAEIWEVCQRSGSFYRGKILQTVQQ